MRSRRVGSNAAHLNMTNSNAKDDNGEEGKAGISKNSKVNQNFGHFIFGKLAFHKQNSSSITNERHQANDTNGPSPSVPGK